MAGDIDPEAMKKDYREQGVLSASGVDFDRFEQLVAVNRDHLYVAPQEFSKAA